MDYESTLYEVDIWQNIAVFTDKRTGACGQVCYTSNGRIATARMLKADVAKYGVEKAVNTWAKLVNNWYN